MQHDFILLDRSSSMSSQWGEALAAVNRYVQKLAEDNVDTGVTLATFDLDCGKFAFNVIRDRIIPRTWHKVTDKDATPRGSTPLNDAIGEIVALANKGIPGSGQQYEKVAIIIMTDGEENASRELSGAAAKNLLEQCRQKGWHVVFLGANYDNMAQAQSYATQARHTVMSTTQNLGQTMTVMASKRAVYGQSLAGSAAANASMDFSELEKQQLATDAPATPTT
jgi:hypothetical protein